MKVLGENKRARFDYAILETFQGGLSLTGHEVKSIKSGRINLSGSYAVKRNGEIFIIGMDIPSFQPKNAPADYSQERSRKVLLTKKEISYLLGKLESGLTLIPLRVYLSNRNLIKVELGLAKSKRKKDKREALKSKAIEKETRQFLAKKIRGDDRL